MPGMRSITNSPRRRAPARRAAAGHHVVRQHLGAGDARRARCGTNVPASTSRRSSPPRPSRRCASHWHIRNSSRSFRYLPPAHRPTRRRSRPTTGRALQVPQVPRRTRTAADRLLQTGIQQLLAARHLNGERNCVRDLHLHGLRLMLPGHGSERDVIADASMRVSSLMCARPTAPCRRRRRRCRASCRPRTARWRRRRAAS